VAILPASLVSRKIIIIILRNILNSVEEGETGSVTERHVVSAVFEADTYVSKRATDADKLSVYCVISVSSRDSFVVGDCLSTI